MGQGHIHPLKTDYSGVFFEELKFHLLRLHIFLLLQLNIWNMLDRIYRKNIPLLVGKDGHLLSILSRVWNVQKVLI